LWHYLTPQKKTAIWAQNYIPFGAQQTQKYFGISTFCTTIGAQDLLSCFWTIDATFDVVASAT